MKENKHIIFFCPGFPNDENETDCIPAMQNFIKGFSLYKPDLKISVISFSYPFKKREYIWHNVNVYALGKNRFDSLKGIKWIQVFNTFKKIYNPKEQTIIQSFWLYDSALIGQWVSRFFKIEHFCMVMGQDASFKNNFRFILPIKKLIIFCPNELSNQKLLNVFGRKANYVIPRGIDENSFSDSEGKRDTDIIWVGNICELKNYKSFLRIIRTLQKELKRIKVIIIGTGSKKDEDFVREFISENNLSTNVLLTGQIKRKEVLKIMSKSKILLHTSSFEDESYAITESLTSGMYAVGYKKVHASRQNLLLGNDENELVTICKSILDNYHPPKKADTYSIKQMTNDFYEIYFQKL